MTVFTLLTVVFVILKLMGYIDWSWFYVVLPSIIHLVLVIFITVIVAFSAGSSRRF